MHPKILAAQPLVTELKKELRHRCEGLKNRGVTPSMCVVLVGDNPASLTYIKNKQKVCEEIGAHFKLIQMPASIAAQDFLSELNKLNQDPSVHGIIIQLPVSESLKALNIPNLVNPEKDIDGFNGVNTQAIYTGTTNLKLLLPCTPKGIINLLNYYGISLDGKNVVIIGRSLIVGKPLSMMLSNFNATVTLAHSKTKNLKQLTQLADIIISAVGKSEFIGSDFLAHHSSQILIDVGINSFDGKLTGDISKEAQDKSLAFTPVPGGVGPMTVISLIENLITATENQVKG
jgi:methylenetetrahydrofolate dehydrogenase (NADP+)/methenyltetrahydrofolate cyclohydrolase